MEGRIPVGSSLRSTPPSAGEFKLPAREWFQATWLHLRIRHSGIGRWSGMAAPVRQSLPSELTMPSALARSAHARPLTEIAYGSQRWPRSVDFFEEFDHDAKVIFKCERKRVYFGTVKDVPNNSTLLNQFLIAHERLLVFDLCK